MLRSPLRAALLPALAALLLTVAACGSGSVEPRVATVLQLRDSTQSYLGERVTVEGSIARVFGPQAFSMDGEDESVLVVFVAPSADVQNAPSGPRRFEPGDAVRVTGTARRFATAAPERDAAQDVDIDYKSDNPALVAQRVVVRPGS